MIPKDVKEKLEKQHYSIVGEHSAIEICRWTKKSLIDEGFCYKEKFYGIKSHRCCQMSPSVMWCQNKCIHCWRPIEMSLGCKIKGKIDSPEDIIDGCIKAQRRMLNGFKGNKKINMNKFEEAQEPMQFAISLSGEPTIYPYLAELILELKKRKKTSFLVTNGLNPEKIKELKEKEALPTQIYISMITSNKKDYTKWHNTLEKNAWKKFNQSLRLLKNIGTRTVARMTLVRGLNIKNEKQYASLIRKAMPDFIEVKAFMSVGYSRKRLGYEKMPSHEEVVEFGKKLEKELKEERYKILDEKKESRVIVLGRNKKYLKILQKD